MFIQCRRKLKNNIQLLTELIVASVSLAINIRLLRS